MESHSSRARKNAWKRWMLCSSFFFAAVGLFLQGCESEEERTLRLSCHWNIDITIKGCSRVGFKDCVDNCEYCLFAKDSPTAGQSDECNQLKCTSFCAKQDSDECSATYRNLCVEGLEYIRQNGGTCDAQCSGAASRFPNSVLPLALFLPLGVFVARCKDNAISLLVLSVAFVSLSLQGCADCPATEPSLSWTADFEKMDRFAGCIDEWDLVKGNPCASDIPIIFSKKGYRKSVDLDFRTGRVENERYECTQRDPQGACLTWSLYESSCDEEDFGYCTCKETGGEGRYCSRWQCVAKEATQHECWKDHHCDSNNGVCVLCGDIGTSPFPMNADVFQALAASDTTVGVLTANASGSLESLRKSHWSYYYYNGGCIMPRKIESAYETPCDRWREIETEVANCECLEEDFSKAFCKRWRCEEKDVGMFSILFTKDRSYATDLSGIEEESYHCLESESNGNDRRCIKWVGDISSYEEVELTQCEATCAVGQGRWCDIWQCNEYELPRVHDEDSWWKRLLFCTVHALWICLVFIIPTASAMETSETNPRMGACILSCVLPIVTVVVWCVCFVRYEDGRLVLPFGPLLFLVLTYLVPLLSLVVLFALVPKGEQLDQAILGALSLATAIFLFCGYLWTTGVIAAVVIISPCLCGGGYMILSYFGGVLKITRSHAGGGSTIGNADDGIADNNTMGNWK